MLNAVTKTILICCIAYATVCSEVRTMMFPIIVQTVRRELKMSQEDLARALNISFATVNRWENGKTHPNKLTKIVFFDFCVKLGLDIEKLKGEEGGGRGV